MAYILILSPSAAPSDVCVSGRQRVWLQFQWLLSLPESQQDWGDPIAEQNSEPFENQVSESSHQQKD